MSTHADRFAYNASYGISTYSKGALLLAQLRYIIGDVNFEKTLKKYKPTVVVECFYKEFFQIKKILKKIGYESYKFSNNGNLIKIYRPNKFEANIIFLPS